VQRGEIWWADLPEPRGSEPGYRRPVLIVQADFFNESRIQTVLTVLLTTNLRRAEAPGNLLLPSRHTGLPKDSVANVSQLGVTDKGNLVEFVSKLPHRYLRQVEDGLRLILDLF